MKRLVLAVVIVSASAALAEPPRTSPYAPYEFLIGEWDIGAEAGGPAVARTLFRWGPGNSYIWYAGSLLVNGVEEPHFEGLLVWNGVRRNLDMLLSLDLRGGRTQEQGTVSIDADGRVVREISAIYSEGARPIGQPPAPAQGATAQFRQTFRRVGPDRIATEVLRDAGGRWVATFPGSDRLVMTRRPPRSAAR